MINWIKKNKAYIVAAILCSLVIIGVYKLGQKSVAQPIPIENTAKIDSLVNVISQKNGQIIQLERDYSDLERLKTQSRVKYRDRIIKVREGDVLVIFEDLRNGLE